jgi:hypothetical protein
MNYWWGIYGLTGKVGWEDINLFDKNNHEYSKIAHTCICSRTYLENCLAELEEDIDEKEYTCEIKEFLNRNQTLFQYNYDKSENEDFYEVPFEAERNEKGIKPCYIETWHMSRSIDEAVIKECVILFCKKFLNSSVDEVIFKDIVSVGEATNEYIEQCELFGGGLEMIFSDDLVKQLEVEWKKPREKVLGILNRSVK